jgi:hypothetical protein
LKDPGEGKEVSIMKEKRVAGVFILAAACLLAVPVAVRACP